jgi:sodium/potassium-transporting ATPase subunit alpha
VATLDRDAPPSDPGLALTARRTVSIQASATGHPSARLPVEFRTMSLQLETTGKAQPADNGKNAVKGTVHDITPCSTFLTPTTDLSDLDWHNVSIDEALRRLGVSPKTGIDTPQVQRRAAQYGANQISPPPSRMLRKVLGWVFGGFGSLLLAASIVCFLAW